MRQIHGIDKSFQVLASVNITHNDAPPVAPSDLARVQSGELKVWVKRSQAKGRKGWFSVYLCDPDPIDFRPINPRFAGVCARLDWIMSSPSISKGLNKRKVREKGMSNYQKTKDREKRKKRNRPRSVKEADKIYAAQRKRLANERREQTPAQREVLRKMREIRMANARY